MTPACLETMNQHAQPDSHTENQDQAGQGDRQIEAIRQVLHRVRIDRSHDARRG